ncbi:hypothetical protein B0A55_01184 [Friedmanniomyces simplex]|uniref:Uncharacterized protein n=1 Tax=Friedmanniomyces simplex TaxID=329884 RepID=A0A4V5NIC9_9PEZI|nr:hypothetical protein B0A55_01184 [Friedmanniomyces simplex]
MSKPIAFIIGAGKNIGASTTKALQAKGYRVAQAARSVNPDDSKDDDLLLKNDLSKPDNVASLFARLRKSWGEPSVVIYNAAAAHFTPKDDPFSVSVEDFTSDLAINTISTYAAIKEALASFESLPSSAPKAFFFTGNCLNQVPMLGLQTAGVGKSATAHMIQTASLAYADKGMKFHYVDERTSEGKPKINPYVDGPAHADFFLELMEGRTDEVPWLATFVKGQGYTSFAKL